MMAELVGIFFSDAPAGIATVREAVARNDAKTVEFEAHALGANCMAHKVYEDLNPAQKARVTRAFVSTSRYEWMFWDAAWKPERWPV